MLNSWMNDPEAFSSDYEEYQELMREVARENAEHEAELLREARAEIQSDDPDDEDFGDFEDDCLLDGDAESALASIGWGTDEDYGYYGGEGW